jgi:hypothetical protein
MEIISYDQESFIIPADDLPLDAWRSLNDEYPQFDVEVGYSESGFRPGLIDIHYVLSLKDGKPDEEIQLTFADMHSLGKDFAEYLKEQASE